MVGARTTGVMAIDCGLNGSACAFSCDRGRRTGAAPERRNGAGASGAVDGVAPVDEEAPISAERLVDEEEVVVDEEVADVDEEPVEVALWLALTLSHCAN